MGRFKKKGKSESPGINTSSLPDIVFMLLFFFMVATTMRETTPLVKTKLPKATEIQKLEKKSWVSYINVGPPMNQAKYGTAPRIQLNDEFADKNDIIPWVETEKESRDERVIPYLTWSLKVDQSVKMGIVTDIKQELRKANALKINYSTRKRQEN